MRIDQSSLIKGIVIGLGITFAVILIFSFGVFVGHKKAYFSYRWSDNYHRDFWGGSPKFFKPKPYFSGHGAFGEVIDVGSKQLIIEDSDDVEKVILTSDKTKIIEGFQEIGLDKIKVGDKIAVIGAPKENNNGKIEARLIRLFPDEDKDKNDDKSKTQKENDNNSKEDNESD